MTQPGVDKQGSTGAPTSASTADAARAASAATGARRQLIAARRVHWARTRRLTAVLLLLWLATTFCTVFFARQLSALTLFGWPLSFYMAAQGASLIYLAILAVYALAMQRADLRFAAQLRSPYGDSGNGRKHEAPPHVL